MSFKLNPFTGKLDVVSSVSEIISAASGVYLPLAGGILTGDLKIKTTSTTAFTIDNALGTRFITANTTNGWFKVGDDAIDAYADANTQAYFINSINGYHAVNIINSSTGVGASSDMVICNNSLGAASGYVDFGINSTTNTDANYLLFGANSGYAFSVDSNFYVGTASATKDLVFFAGPTSAVASGKMRIKGEGSITMSISGTKSLTLTNTLVDSTTGFVHSVATSGTGSASRSGFVLTMTAGATGSGFSNGFSADNQVAMTSSAYNSDTSATGYCYRPSGNRGLSGYMHSNTTGHNIGGLYIATGGAANYALFASSTGTKASAYNIGIFANGLNGGASSFQFGGIFMLMNSASAPVWGTSAALVADNVSQTSDIFDARDNNASVFQIADGGYITHTPTASTSGIPNHYIFSTPADTGITASTESISVTYAFAGNTRTWATGALTTQREFAISAPTYAFAGASTITNAATFAITGAPVAGTNATITNSYSFWIQEGAVRFDGGLFLNNTSITGVGSAITGTAGTALTISTPAHATELAGTNIKIKAADAVTSTAQNYAGGIIQLQPGAATGSQAPGYVDFQNTSGVSKMTWSTYGANDTLIGQAATYITYFGIFAGPPTLDFAIKRTASSANYLQVAGAVASSEPSISALGSDTDINIVLTPKGAGVVDASGSSIRIKRSVANVTSPPTDAELDSAFGDPTVVGSGFIGILDDNDAGTDSWVVWTTGTAGEWFYAQGTKAV